MLLETERLILRHFTEDDMDRLAQILGDPEVMRFSLNGPLNREHTEAYLRKRILDHYSTYGCGVYAVICKADGKLIGYSGFKSQEIDGEHLIELAFRFDPAYWGKGFATEAARAVIDYAFRTLHLPKLISIIEAANTRSIQVAKRVGMHLWKETLYHNIPVQIYKLEHPVQSIQK